MLSFEYDLLDFHLFFRFFCLSAMQLSNPCKRKKTANEPKPSAMPNNAISNLEEKLAKG